MTHQLLEVSPVHTSQHEGCYNWVVVCAGFAGAVLAGQLACVHGQRVLVVDSRPHSAASAYEYPNEHSILVDCYGPQIFRANSQAVVDFRYEMLKQPPSHQGGTVNYLRIEEYTRIVEYKYPTGQEHAKTTVTYEYLTVEGDPDYPMPRPENQALYQQYETVADALPDTWFVGRLATYKYFNMNQDLGQALATFPRIEEKVTAG